MYWKSFALREDPFGLTPDSRFLYLSESHREVLSTLREGIEAERGFVALASQPGLGKTTLLHALREQLSEQAVTAFVFQTGLEPFAILRMLWKELGLDASQTDLVKMHQQFAEGLAKVAALGKQFVLFIDEAQGLSPAALETVRLLSNFETGRKKMVEIVLAGQPELEHLLARPGLEHIRQRVSVFCRLKPLTRVESVQYLQHRLNVAGASGPEIFTDEALQLLALLGKGIPRTLNIYAFQAMMSASKRGRPWRAIDATLVRETIHQFEGWTSPPDEPAREPHVDMPVPVVAPRSVTPPQPMHLSARKGEQDDFFAGEKDPALQELLNSVRQEGSKDVQANVDLTGPAPPPFVPSAAPHEPLRMMASFVASAAAPARTADPVPTRVPEPSSVISPVPTPAPASPAVPAPRIAVMPSREAAKVPADSAPSKPEVAPLTSRSEATPAQKPQPAKTKSEPARFEMPAPSPAERQPSADISSFARAALVRQAIQERAGRGVLSWLIAVVALVLLSAGVWVLAKELRSRRVEPPAAVQPPAAPITQPVPSTSVTPDPQPLESIPATPPRSVPKPSTTSKSEARQSSSTTQPEAPTISAAVIATGSTKRIEPNTDAPLPAMPINALDHAPMPSFSSALKAPPSDSVRLQSVTTPPVPSEQPRPEYPLMARQLGLRGEVVLKVQVNKRGRATSVQIVSGHPVLAAAAQNAVKNFWRFHPATMNGESIDGETQVRIVYRAGN